MPKAPTSTSMKVTLRLPEELYDVYAERAAKTGRQPETEMLDRLSICRTHNATSPIYLDDDARNALSQLAGKTMRTAEDVLLWARYIASLKVNGTEITLDERLLKRLSTRTFGKTLPDFLRQAVTEQLEDLVGLR